MERIETINSVVLCSGGMDSVTVLAMANQVTFPHVLFINYNQKTNLTEEKFARGAAGIYSNSFYIHKIDLHNLTISSLLSGEENNNKETEVVGRNTIFIGLACAYAKIVKAKAIYIGIHQDDVIYGDASRMFYRYMKQAIVSAYKIELRAPLINFNKKQIVELAKDYDINLDQTYSCYFNSSKPCGTCPSCLARELGKT